MNQKGSKIEALSAHTRSFYLVCDQGIGKGPPTSFQSRFPMFDCISHVMILFSNSGGQLFTTRMTVPPRFNLR